MIAHRIRTFTEYRRHAARLGPVHAARKAYELRLQEPHHGPFTVTGFSYAARRMVDFRVDFAHGDGRLVNWRERLVCPATHLNNRVRAALHLLDSELGLTSDESVYITEQVTPLHAFLSQRHTALTASEFCGPEVPSGTVTTNGIRHEDLTKLSFQDASFDVVMSFDCLEHIPNATAAFHEMARVVKPGGRLMWSVPFRRDRETNLIRTSVGADGTLEHHYPPEYHADPLTSAGCLCYTHFGWQMLEQVRAAGFRDTYALAYWSDIFGYLGVEQLLFFATK